jgi:hypothetical protein
LQSCLIRVWLRNGKLNVMTVSRGIIPDNLFQRKTGY